MRVLIYSEIVKGVRFESEEISPGTKLLVPGTGFRVPSTEPRP